MKRQDQQGIDISSESARFIVWIWIVLILAFTLRFVYFLEVRTTPFFDNLILDLATYDSWGQKIAEGEWLGSSVFYQDPLYPYFLGSIYALFGRHFEVVYFLQMLLGTFTCYLVYWIGKKTFSPLIGIMAAAVAATYKPFIFYDVQVEKSFLAVLIVTVSYALLLQARENTGNRGWIFSGLSLGLAVLVRGNYLFILPFVLLGVMYCAREMSVPQRIRVASLYTLGVALVLLTTLVRNYYVGDDLVLTTSQAGQNFFIGNNPENLTGMYRAPKFVRADPKFEEVDFAREAERLSGRDLKPSEVSAFWFRRAFSFIADRPTDYLNLLWQKACLFWNNYEIPDNLDMYFFERYSIVMRIWFPGFGVIAALGVVGMVLCLRDWRRLWLLYLFTLGYFVSVILFYVFSRYRLPVVPFLIIFAMQALREMILLYRQRKLWVIGAYTCLLIAATSAFHLPLVNAYNPSALDNLGAILMRMGDMENAESLFREVLARRPNFADARNNLGIILLRKGDIDAALVELREAIRLKPLQANGFINLGQALLRRGDHDGAKEAFERALQLDPAIAEAYAGLGLQKKALGDLTGAVDALRKALQLSPKSTEIRNNLAIALIGSGQMEEAITQLDEAIRLNGNFADAHYNKGICLERLRRIPEAIEAYRQTIAARVDYAEAYNNLGNLLVQVGDKNGALEAYLKFAEYWKGDPSMLDAVREEIEKLLQ